MIGVVYMKSISDYSRRYSCDDECCTWDVVKNIFLLIIKPLLGMGLLFLNLMRLFY